MRSPFDVQITWSGVLLSALQGAAAYLALGAVTHLYKKYSAESTIKDLT